MASTKPPRMRQPQIEILELKSDRLVFLLSKTDISVANALRRVILAEVIFYQLNNYIFDAFVFLPLLAIV